MFFCGLGLVLCRKQTTRNLSPIKSSALYWSLCGICGELDASLRCHWDLRTLRENIQVRIYMYLVVRIHAHHEWWCMREGLRNTPRTADTSAAASACQLKRGMHWRRFLCRPRVPPLLSSPFYLVPRPRPVFVLSRAPCVLHTTPTPTAFAAGEHCSWRNWGIEPSVGLRGPDPYSDQQVKWLQKTPLRVGRCWRRFTKLCWVGLGWRT